MRKRTSEHIQQKVTISDIQHHKTFAKRNIRSLKGLHYKYLEENWTYSYIDKLPDFVNTVNSRTNRVTKLASIEVTKKDVPRLILSRVERLSNKIRSEKDSFTVTLVSSASLNNFNDNSLASFKNLLSNYIDLQGEWIVALR